MVAVATSDVITVVVPLALMAATAIVLVALILGLSLLCSNYSFWQSFFSPIILNYAHSSYDSCSQFTLCIVVLKL